MCDANTVGHTRRRSHGDAPAVITASASASPLSAYVAFIIIAKWPIQIVLTSTVTAARAFPAVDHRHTWFLVDKSRVRWADALPPSKCT